MNAYDAAASTGREADLHEELTQLFEQENRGDADHTEIAATYLKVSIDR